MQHDLAGGTRPDIEQAERAAEKALEDQRAAEKKAVSDQQAVRDKLSADVAAREKAQLEAFHGNQNLPGLPGAPGEPASIEAAGTPQQQEQQKEQGKKALSAYQEAGYVTARETQLVPGANPAEKAWEAEKQFRERQQQLADKIADPGTSPEQRERLTLVKTTEYHAHKADQMQNVISLQRDTMRYSMGHQAAGQAAIDEHQKQLDHHKSQAVLAAQKLHTFDHARNAVPKEVQARMGQAAQQPPLHQNTQGQKELASDPHIQALAHGVAHQEQSQTAAPTAKEGQGHAAGKDLPEAQNPAAARLLARIKAAGERNDIKTTPEMDQRMQEIGASREKLAAAQELQKTEALGRKAELEQRAAVRH